MFLAYIGALLGIWLIVKLYNCRRKGVTVRDMVTVEVLEPFYSMLKNKDREFWFNEEVGCRERVGIKRIS